MSKKHHSQLVDNSKKYCHQHYFKSKDYIMDRLGKVPGLTRADLDTMGFMIHVWHLSMAEIGKMRAHPRLTTISEKIACCYTYACGRTSHLVDMGFLKKFRRPRRNKDGSWWAKTNLYYPGPKLNDVLVRFTLFSRTNLGFSRTDRKSLQTKDVMSFSAKTDLLPDPSPVSPSRFVPPNDQKPANMTPQETASYYVNLVLNMKGR